MTEAQKNAYLATLNGKTPAEVEQIMQDEIAKITVNPPVEILNMFKYHIIESGMGQAGQHYNGYPFIHGGMRMMGYYIIPNIYRMADSDLFTIEHMRWHIEKIKIETEFLGYCGLHTQELFGDYLIALSFSMTDKVAFRDLLGTYALYLEIVNSWMQHYYPWSVGCVNLRKSPEELQELAAAINVVYPPKK